MLLNVAQPVVGENGAVKEISSSRCVEGRVGLWHSADPRRHRDGVIDRTFDLPPAAWSFGFPPLLWFLKLDISQKLKPIMVSGAAQYLFVIGRVGLMVALDGEPVAFV